MGTTQVTECNTMVTFLMKEKAHNVTHLLSCYLIIIMFFKQVAMCPCIFYTQYVSKIFTLK